MIFFNKIIVSFCEKSRSFITTEYVDLWDLRNIFHSTAQSVRVGIWICVSGPITASVFASMWDLILQCRVFFFFRKLYVQFPRREGDIISRQFGVLFLQILRN